MIEVENLSKNFGKKTAVDGITFEVNPGEILGFLGPNGAGKSTTMRMITGFLTPSSGSIRINNQLLTENPLKARSLIGYLPENAPCYPDMTVSDFLRFSAKIRGLRGAEVPSAIDKVLEMCFLQQVKNQSIDTLSKGYRHRTCLAQSLIHDPPILIMDEPTDGLDPNQKHEIRTLIRSMGEQKTIIFSTHILEEVEEVCTRAIIINHGKIVANGTPESLKQKDKRSAAFEISLQLPAEANDPVPRLQSLREVGSVRHLEKNTFLLFPKPGAPSSLFSSLQDLIRQENWILTALHPHEGKLDRVFRAITNPDSTTTDSNTQPHSRTTSRKNKEISK